jgi:hypothetical protein
MRAQARRRATVAHITSPREERTIKERNRTGGTETRIL